jgi:hypothetical protein
VALELAIDTSQFTTGRIAPIYNPMVDIEPRPEGDPDEGWFRAWLGNRLPERMRDRWGPRRTLGISFIWGLLIGCLALLWGRGDFVWVVLFVSMLFAAIEPHRRAMWFSQLLGCALPLLVAGLLGGLRLN